jgi:hypothetical protein
VKSNVAKLEEKMHLVLVAAESSDVKLDPFEGGKLISEGQIQGASVVSFLALRESQWSQAVVKTDVNHRRSLGNYELEFLDNLVKRTRATL